MRVRVITLACLLVSAAVVAGCGKAKAVKTNGRVTLDDQPVEGALVRFIPVDAAKGSVASGVTGSDGTFRLTTTNPNDGAVPGDYIVTVTLEERREAPPGMAGGPQGGMRPGEMADQFKGLISDQKKAAGAGGKEPGKKATKIPASYGDQKTSPLKAKIPADGEIPLALRSKGG
jgi:hypothetical protein